MRLHRFYVNKPLGEEIVVERAGEEKELIHQWTNVFRFTSGDEVFLFSKNTPGTDFLYQLGELSKDGFTLSLKSKRSNIIPPREIVLVMALVKKDTFETVVRQATELGVSRIIPLSATHSEKKNLNFERLSAISKEAAEQSGRGTIPHIDPIMSFGEAFSSTKDYKNIFGSLRGTQKETSTHSEKLALWIGPEGGWTKEEEEQASQYGFSLYKLTETTLRADTAAIALLSAILG